MATLPVGYIMSLPDLPGRWQVWSMAGEARGAYFFVPYDEAARATRFKYVVAKIVYPKHQPKPTITVLRTESFPAKHAES